GNELAFTAKAQPEPALDAKEVERVLESIHKATAELSQPKEKRSGAVATGRILVKSLPDPGASETKSKEIIVTPDEAILAGEPKKEEPELAGPGDEIIFGDPEGAQSPSPVA